MGRLPTEKRARLVSAAMEQFHLLGYARTSIADVAQRAGIASGNVFYYFKTKEDLAQAVVDAWCQWLVDNFEKLETAGDAFQRLDGFLEQACARREDYATRGCPLAGLTRDLRRESGSVAGDVGRMYDIQFAWVAGEFQRAGLSKATAAKQARFFLTGYHGALHLSFVQNDGSFIDHEAARLKGSIANLRRQRLLTK